MNDRLKDSSVCALGGNANFDAAGEVAAALAALQRLRARDYAIPGGISQREELEAARDQARILGAELRAAVRLAPGAFAGGAPYWAEDCSAAAGAELAAVAARYNGPPVATSPLCRFERGLDDLVERALDEELAMSRATACALCLGCWLLVDPEADELDVALAGEFQRWRWAWATDFDGEPCRKYLLLNRLHENHPDAGAIVPALRIAIATLRGSGHWPLDERGAAAGEKARGQRPTRTARRRLANGEAERLVQAALCRRQVDPWTCTAQLLADVCGLSPSSVKSTSRWREIMKVRRSHGGRPPKGRRQQRRMHENLRSPVEH